MINHPAASLHIFLYGQIPCSNANAPMLSLQVLWFFRNEIPPHNPQSTHTSPSYTDADVSGAEGEEAKEK